MAAAELLPRFFKVYVAHLSSDSMLIPLTYYDELPKRLPKMAILQGPGGRSWKVSFMKKEDEVHFGKGWVKFAQDNRLCDGDFLTFVYNGDRIFDVSIFRHDGCKEIKEEEVNDKEDRVSLSSGETEAETESEMSSPIPRIKNKGKLKEKVVEDSHGDGDDDEFVEGFGRLGVSDDSDNSDSSYSPDMKYPIASVKPKATNSKKKEEASDKCWEVARRSIVKPRIKNPERYLDDPKNIHLETCVKNRSYELLVHSQLVKDYDLKFEPFIHYIDKIGLLEANTATWSDERVVVKKWNLICERNKLKKKDAILCEFFRKRNVVYAIKVHIIRGKDL